ncbi:kinase-like protein [Xylaria telfairii]|nr:kinase-like protein [Xylaria telfairii]
MSKYLAQPIGGIPYTYSIGSIFHLSRCLIYEFAGSCRLRMSVDSNRKDRILYIDVRPDNIFVNWTCNEEGNETVTNATLGDFGTSYEQDKEVLAELAKLGITPCEGILTRHFTYFRLVNETLLKQVDNHEHNNLKKALAIDEVAVKHQPELGFEVWGKELSEAVPDMISRITKLNLTARLTINQVLGCLWW